MSNRRILCRRLGTPAEDVTAGLSIARRSRPPAKSLQLLRKRTLNPIDDRLFQVLERNGITCCVWALAGEARSRERAR
jgi:hypothetical protein